MGSDGGITQYTLLEKVAESIRIENARPGKKEPMKLLVETRRALTAAIYSGGVKPSWVRLREEKPIRICKGKGESWSLAKLRTALKTCREIVLIPIKRAGNS